MSASLELSFNQGKKMMMLKVKILVKVFLNAGNSTLVSFSSEIKLPVFTPIFFFILIRSFPHLLLCASHDWTIVSSPSLTLILSHNKSRKR